MIDYSSDRAATRLRERSRASSDKRFTWLAGSWNAAERRSAAWDFTKAPANFLARATGHVGNALLSFAVVVVVTRSLGSTGWGVVAAITAGSQLVLQLAVQWSAFALSRIGCEEFVATGRMPQTFWTRSIILAITCAALVLTSSVWLGPLAASLAIPRALRWLILGQIVVFALWLHMQFVLQGFKMPTALAGLLMLERLVVLLIVCGLSLTHASSPSAVIGAYLAGAAVATVAATLMTRALVGPPVRPQRQAMIGLVRYAGPLLPTMIFGFLSSHFLDAFFLSRQRGFHELGVFAVATQVVGVASQFLLIAGSLVLPFLVSLPADKAERHIRRLLADVVPYSVAVWSAIGVLIATITSFAVPLVFGKQFEAVSILAWPMAAATAVAAPWVLGYGPAAHHARRTRINAVMTISAAIANVGLNLLWIPRYGLLGCAWASVVSFALASTVAMGLYSRRLGRSEVSCLVASFPVVLAAVVATLTGSAVLAASVGILAVTILLLRLRQGSSGILRSLMLTLQSPSPAADPVGH